MNLKSFLLIGAVLLVVCSCDKNGTDHLPKGSGKAVPVYNQAYQENFEADHIADILLQAKNAYVLIDPFEDDNFLAIAAIQANGNAVGAYISIGTGETYRDDFMDLQPFLVKKPWGQWPDEYFVNSTTTGVLEVMKKRIDQIALWGCDWVEFDNMDWIFDFDLRTTYGFVVTQVEGITYYQALCNYAHQKGLKVMAKNTVRSAEMFDGVLYESYNDDKNWWDESGAKSFLSAGKLVIINHYNETQCAQVYANYKKTYNTDLSFICEDAVLKKYVHFNQ